MNILHSRQPWPGGGRGAKSVYSVYVYPVGLDLRQHFSLSVFYFTYTNIISTESSSFSS